MPLRCRRHMPRRCATARAVITREPIFTMIFRRYALYAPIADADERADAALPCCLRDAMITPMPRAASSS